MKLLKYENYEVVPTEECMLVRPLRKLYQKDRTKDKERFMQIVSFIYHYCDPRSSYSDIFDDEERMRRIKEQEGLDDNFTITAELQEAIDIYKELTTTSTLKLLDSMKKAIAKIGEFLENVNLYDIDEKTGKPLYNVGQIVQATDKIPQLAKRLIETEKIVASEIEEASRMRGGDDRAHAFEGGFN